MFMYYRMTKANKTPGLIGDGCHLNTMDTLGDKLYIQINDILIFVKICSGLKGEYIKTPLFGYTASCTDSGPAHCPDSISG